MKKPIKILTYGPQHAGKTMSSILMAAGIVAEERGCTVEEAFKYVKVFDTEYKRALLHRGLGEFQYEEITAPYTLQKLTLTLAKAVSDPNVDVVIYDSLTHFWAKSGGVLEQKAMKDRQGGNSYANWQEFTMAFNKVIDTLMSSNIHLICNCRSKNDTALVTDTGKAVPKTYGLKPEMRDGIEYEFDIVFNVDKDTHRLLLDKGLPDMAPMYDPATTDFGREIANMFDMTNLVPPRTAKAIQTSIKKAIKANDKLKFVQLELSGKKLADLTDKELLSLEDKLAKEIAKDQIKKK